MQSLAAPKAMIFTSDCVDVIELESEPWVEKYWVITRPCSAIRGCYRAQSCPAWQRALKAIGEWAEGQTPDWQAVADGGEEYVVSRVNIDLPRQRCRPHDHWAWEALAGEPLAPRAAGFLSMGLELGDQAYAICTDDLREEVSAVEGFPAQHPNLFWRRAEDMIDCVTGLDGRITEESVDACFPTSPLGQVAARCPKVWVFTNHLYLLQDRWVEGMVVEAKLNRLVGEFEMSVACAVPDLTPQMLVDRHYEQMCRQHARVVVVSTDG